MGLPLRKNEEAIRDLEYLKKKAWFRITGYIPHEAQEELHRSTADGIVAICGRQFGKSRAAAKEIELTALKAKTRQWIVAPTYDLTDKVFREVADTFVIKDKSKFVAKYSEHERKMILKNGSEIIGKSADNPKSLVGENIDRLIIDEASKIKQTIWEKYLSPTLLARHGRVLFITTPEGKDWVYKLFMQVKLSEYANWDAFHFPSSVNPHLSKKMLEERKRTLSKEAFEQEYEAKFVTFKGKVYKTFDLGIHVSADMPADFDQIILGIDIGFVNPSAILVVGIKDGRFYVLDEVYEAQLLDKDIIERVIGIKAKYPKLKDGYCDPAAPDKIKAINSGVPGIRIFAAKNDVTQGIELVAQQLKVLADGQPSLKIHPRCENTIEEIDAYRYADKRDLSNVKEEPVKANDHAPDALRYAVYSLKKMHKPMSFKGSFL